MIQRLSRQFISRFGFKWEFQGLLKANRNIRKYIEREIKKSMDDLKQSYGEFNSKYPNGKYAIAAFFLTTYIMYEMKR